MKSLAKMEKVEPLRSRQQEHSVAVARLNLVRSISPLRQSETLGVTFHFKRE